MIETYAKVLLAGDNESSAEQYDAIGPALDHLLEVDPGLTSADACEMVSSVMGRVFEEGGLDSDDALDEVKNIDQNIIEPAFMSPTAEPALAHRDAGSSSQDSQECRQGCGETQEGQGTQELQYERDAASQPRTLIPARPTGLSKTLQDRLDPCCP